MSLVASNLTRLGITLPVAPKPIASYLPYVMAGGLVFISGQLPSQDGKVIFQGKVPVTLSLENGRQAARLAVINALAVLHTACEGHWERVDHIVRLGVFVQCSDGFQQQSSVANGASDLLVEVFGEGGRHARAAVGVNALPLGAAVEVELIVQLK